MNNIEATLERALVSDEERRHRREMRTTAFIAVLVFLLLLSIVGTFLYAIWKDNAPSPFDIIREECVKQGGMPLEMVEGVTCVERGTSKP